MADRTVYISGTPFLAKDNGDGTWSLQQHVQGQGAATEGPLAMTQAPKAAWQTLKFFTGTITTSTSGVTVVNLNYAVSAGKTFYLTDVSFCNNTSNASQVSVNASLTANTSPLIMGHTINTSPFEMANIGSEPSAAAGSQMSVQAGQTTAATTLTYFVAGYEQ